MAKTTINQTAVNSGNRLYDGEVAVSRRITPEVIEALTRCREPLLALAAEMASDAGPDGPFVEQFARDILQCRNNYVAGAWDYAIWQMVR